MFVSQLLHRPGWSNFSFPRVKNTFYVGPKGQETSPGCVFENLQTIFFLFKNTCSEITNYHNICSNINFTEICTITIQLHIILNLLLQQLVSHTNFTLKTYI
jgi:hypothetical protein